MKAHLALPLAAAATMALLSACSKPADTAANATSNAADSAATATNNAADSAANAAGDASASAANATSSGGAVSPPASNGAINTDANKTSTDVAPASNSFTESQARGHIEHAGYSDVTGLTKTPDGLWTGKAKKGGKTVSVTVDFKGAVTPQ